MVHGQRERQRPDRNVRPHLTRRAVDHGHRVGGAVCHIDRVRRIVDREKLRVRPDDDCRRLNMAARPVRGIALRAVDDRRRARCVRHVHGVRGRVDGDPDRIRSRSHGGHALLAAAGVAGVARLAVDQGERAGRAVPDVDRVGDRIQRDAGRKATDLNLRVRVPVGRCAERRSRKRDQRDEEDAEQSFRVQPDPRVSGLQSIVVM